MSLRLPVKGGSAEREGGLAEGGRGEEEEGRGVLFLSLHGVSGGGGGGGGQREQHERDLCNWQSCCQLEGTDKVFYARTKHLNDF